MIPAAPGQAGTFQAGVKVSLSLFVPAAVLNGTGLAFANVMWLATMLHQVALGLLMLTRGTVTLGGARPYSPLTRARAEGSSTGALAGASSEVTGAGAGTCASRSRKSVRMPQPEQRRHHLGHEARALQAADARGAQGARHHGDVRLLDAQARQRHQRDGLGLGVLVRHQPQQRVLARRE